MTIWNNPHNADLGMLPHIFSEHDPRPAAEQAEDKYSYGGGWTPFEGFRVAYTDHQCKEVAALRYPGDRDLRVLAWTTLRDEQIYLFECSWVAIINSTTESCEISRMD